jgi:hypothetical protein
MELYIYMTRYINQEIEMLAVNGPTATLKINLIHLGILNNTPRVEIYKKRLTKIQKMNEAIKKALE